MENFNSREKKVTRENLSKDAPNSQTAKTAHLLSFFKHKNIQIFSQKHDF